MNKLSIELADARYGDMGTVAFMKIPVIDGYSASVNKSAKVNI